MYAHAHAIIATPVGHVSIEGDTRVHAIRIGVEGSACRSGVAAIDDAAEQLARYFAGEPVVFDCALAPPRTPRGGDLRAAIVGIGYGATETYGEVARRIASSARAIGQACRHNPFPIVVPCHRVLGGSGHYSAGDSLRTKNWLLDHERRHIRRD